MVKWGDFARDFDTILAVRSKYSPFYAWWFLEEFALPEGAEPAWRERRIPSELGHVKLDVYPSEEATKVAAKKLNAQFEQDLAERKMDEVQRRSLQLKISKGIQAAERLADEEALMLAEARRRHLNDTRPTIAELVLAEKAELHRAELFALLSEFPYLTLALVRHNFHAYVLYRSHKNEWSLPYPASQKLATAAFRARIGEGFGLPAGAHWGKAKATIRQILLPRANLLLQLASVRRLLAEALTAGKQALVINGYVFWYEEDGALGWLVKETASSANGVGHTVWKEGTILSTNYGRLVILPYIKEDGEHVRGHTRNAPNDGKAKPRHPDHYVNIPFEELDGDLMIGLFGELPYE